MSKVIICANQKGGVAKTTTVNLGIGLARLGKKVLLIDNDPQGSLTEALGYQQPDSLDTTLANIMDAVLNEELVNVEAGILQHGEGVDLMPANIELSGVETSLIGIMSSETILKEYIEMIGPRYDYVIIDCSPNLGQLTLNALVAADEIIIPVQAAYLPIKGLEQLLKTISKVKRKMNPNCSIIDILGAPDMDSCEYLSKHFGTQTIHKASDSDAKDYKGSSSRSEDVMQKPLLSAEDIFAMKKDGECAIVIKGADPLFETKCRMEKTAFEKHNLMMSLVQGTEKSDVDIDADKDVDVKSKKLFCCPLFKKRKEKGSKTKGKESYKELAGYIMESEYLSAAQIEQLRLAAKAGMPQEDILRLAKRGKEPMEIRKCVEFYEMTKNR